MHSKGGRTCTLCVFRCAVFALVAWVDMVMTPRMCAAPGEFGPGTARRARDSLFGRNLSGDASSTATRPFSPQIAPLAGMAAMIDRPDRGIETGAAGASRQRQG